MDYMKQSTHYPDEPVFLHTSRDRKAADTREFIQALREFAVIQMPFDWRRGMDDPANTCPLYFFTQLSDPRAANIRHRLVDILIIALCAMICDAKGWHDLEDFAKAKASWFSTFLNLRHSVPLADTFRRVLSRLDPDAFEHPVHRPENKSPETNLLIDIKLLPCA